MSKYYLRIEAVNLSNFIADTQDLSTIRGGSLLLLNAVDEIPGELPSLHLTTMTTGASAGLYSFEADDEIAASNVRDEIASRLQTDNSLKHATFVVDFQLAHEEGEFALDLAMLTARNRWRQMRSPTVAINDLSSSLVCEKDLVRPATQTVPGPVGTHLSVSSSVAARRLAGQELKQAFYRRQIGSSLQAHFVRELEELTTDKSKANLSGKMAVLYLDGNRFGQIKSTLSHSPAAWLNFDTVLKEYRRNMLNGLLDLMTADDNWKTADNRCRIETLMWGGDEILWVVPAWKGWETLSYFYQTSSSWKLGDQPLRHAGGMVFCHHHAPIHRIVTLAKNLAELAKEESRTENLFAYEVLESFDHIGRALDGYRKERSVQPIDPTEEPDTRSLILRGEHMSGLSAFARSIREQIPRKQLHDVVAELLSPARIPEDPSRRASSLEERHQNRKKLLDRLTATLKKGGVSAETLETVASVLGGEEPSWIHLNALWDYLTQE